MDLALCRANRWLEPTAEEEKTGMMGAYTTAKQLQAAKLKDLPNKCDFL